MMFGIDLLDASLLPAMMIALLAGGLSFISPCVLPIVPPYLAYMGGISMPELRQGGPHRLRVVMPAMGFVLGLSTVFLILGFAASAFGRMFLDYLPVLSKIFGVGVIVLGLHFLGIIRFSFLDRDMRFDAGDQGGSVFGAYVLGLAFAFGWTPCIGPQLSAILSLAATEANMTKGTVLLGTYAVGLGIPFLLAALFVDRMMGFADRIKRHMRAVERGMGVLLVGVGLALITGVLSQVSFFLLEQFPFLATIG